MTRSIFRPLKVLITAGYYLLVAFPLVVSAAQVSLQWDANNPSPDGYNLYQRVEGQSYDYSNPVNQNIISGTTFTIEGLQPGWRYFFVVRAAAGSDESGDSNEVDFMAPMTPGNNSPDQPVLQAPANGARHVALAPTLVTGAFCDQDGDEHASTRYQIAVDSDWDNLAVADFVFDGVFESHLTDLTLVDLILDPETTYYWRVKFIDARNGASDWSATSVFTTIDHLQAGLADDDGDGILNGQEVGRGEVILGQVSDDLMVIGTDDRQNPQLGIALSANADIVTFRSVNADAIDPRNAPEAFTGLISFKLRLLAGTTTAHVTVHLSQPAPPNALWYKYRMEDGWVPYDHATFSTDRRSVTIQLTDGGFGDDDGVQNGLIVDPSGLGYSSQTSDASSSSDTIASGCFIASGMPQKPGDRGHARHMLVVGLLVFAALLFKKCPPGTPTGKILPAVPRSPNCVHAHNSGS